MELSPKHEQFVQKLFKHGFNKTGAYMEVYPKANYSSARHSASILFGNVYIQRRVTEIMDAEKVEVRALIKKLKSFLKPQKYKSEGKVVFRPVPIRLQIEVIKIFLRLHGVWGNQIYFTSEQVDQIEKESDEAKS